MSMTFAQVVDFEDLGVTVNSQIDPPDGTGVISRGFHYEPGPLNSFDDVHIVWDNGNNASNGTVVGTSHDDVILTAVSGGPFSVFEFDFAGFQTDAEVPFSVTGELAAGGQVVANFTPDGLVDGPGGDLDFETFSLVGFNNVTSVTWVHTGAGTVAGLFALDNIVTSIPEPASVVLLSLACFSVVAMRRFRH